MPTKEEERIFQGIMFTPMDPELKAMKLKAHNLNIDYNQLHEDEYEKRTAILKDMLGTLNPGVFLQGPITFHYGVHTTIGKGTFINFNFTCQDDAPVSIGEGCVIGPNVTIVTPMHPMLAEERFSVHTPDGVGRGCYALPVSVGNNCWFGANVVVCPGVTIGDGCVIGAGSVVTRSIPANSFAAGNPCRVIRELGEKDSMKNKPEILADCIIG